MVSIWLVLFLNLVGYSGVQNSVLEESGDDHVETEPEDSEYNILLYFFLGLAVGGIIREIVKLISIPIPYRALLMLFGTLAGIFYKSFTGSVRNTEIIVLGPHRTLILFLPIIVFKTAFCMDTHSFIVSWGQIFILAVPGIIINAIIVGSLLVSLLGTGQWTFPMGLMFGIICSPVYPAEVVDMLKKVSLTKHLSILLEGESIIGDSTVLIIFEIIVGVVEGYIKTWYHYIFVFGRFSIGGFVFGFICGKILCWCISKIGIDPVNTLILTIVGTFLCFYIATEFLVVSGVITVIILGSLVSSERTSFSTDTDKFLFTFWEMFAYLSNAVVFLAVGMVVGATLFSEFVVKDAAFVVVTYIVVIVVRFLVYLMLAPIVSRIGYGLTFRNLIVGVWGGLRGPLPLFLTLIAQENPSFKVMDRELLIHVSALVMLTLLINAPLMPFVVNLLGLSEIPTGRLVNMNICMRQIHNRRTRCIAILKMDRFLADANWPIVNTTTLLTYPYKITSDDIDMDDHEASNYLGYRMVTCPDCKSKIPNEPTDKELSEMTREARLRILKALKVSYACQYESGVLSKESMRVLTQAIETAMDTEECLIELEGLHKLFKHQGVPHYVRRKLLNIVFAQAKKEQAIPRNDCRRVCYYIVKSSAFEMFMYMCIVLHIVLIGIQLGISPQSGSSISSLILLGNTIFFVIYFMEFILKIYAYAYIYVWKHGVKTYFRSYWNIFDFILLCIALSDIVLDYLDMHDSHKVMDKSPTKIFITLRILRVFRLLRMVRLCKTWQPRIIQYCESKIDQRVAFAYDVGKGFVKGEEEVSEKLVQMIDNIQIREDCRLRIETDRLAITKELGMIQKDRPWIAITVKTKQAIRSTLNNIVDGVIELKESGWIDDAEYGLLMESVEERIKYVRTNIKSVQPSPPKILFKEVPWMTDDEQISDFLYQNVLTKVFDQGDVICTAGEMSEGIYIIVTGLLKLSYVPTKEILDNLRIYGMLPIIDYMPSARFEETFEDYIVSGNCIGELSVLTGRPYNCTIVADTASQAYVLSHDTIKLAIQRNPNLVNGLESKMWKCICVRLASSILMDTQAYQSSTQEKIRFLLEPAFMPNMYTFKVFAVTEMIEDIVLIEGVVFDYNTRDCYTAPCYIPRTVQRIVLPTSSQTEFISPVRTQMMIIPSKDVDQFDIMEREADVSEMVSTVSSKCLLHSVQRQKRKKRKSLFGIGPRRLIFGDSTSHSIASRSMIAESSFAMMDDERELHEVNMNDDPVSTKRTSYQSSYDNKNKTQTEKMTKTVPKGDFERSRQVKLNMSYDPDIRKRSTIEVLKSDTGSQATEDSKYSVNNEVTTNMKRKPSLKTPKSTGNEASDRGTDNIGRKFVTRNRNDVLESTTPISDSFNSAQARNSLSIISEELKDDASRDSAPSNDVD